MSKAHLTNLVALASVGEISWKKKKKEELELKTSMGGERWKVLIQAGDFCENRETYAMSGRTSIKWHFRMR